MEEIYFELNYELYFNDKENDSINLYEKHKSEADSLIADAFYQYSEILKNIKK